MDAHFEAKRCSKVHQPDSDTVGLEHAVHGASDPFLQVLRPQEVWRVRRDVVAHVPRRQVDGRPIKAVVGGDAAYSQASGAGLEHIKVMVCCCCSPLLLTWERRLRTHVRASRNIRHIRHVR